MDKIDLQEAVQYRLERLLSIHSMSKAELARRSGLPSRTVENYFKGHTPSLDALLAIAKGNEITIDWLLGAVAPRNKLVGDDLLRLAVKEAATELLNLTNIPSQPKLEINSNGSLKEITIDELIEYLVNNSEQKYAYLSEVYTDSE